MITRRDITIAILAACAGFGVFAASRRDAPIMGSSAFEWNSIPVKETKLGSTRRFFRSPTATLDELDCHVTTLNPGESSHLPHKHPHEELVIIREGTVEALVNGEVKKVGPGSVIFNASIQVRSLQSVGSTPARY